MIESGLVEYWSNYYWPSIKQCDANNQKYGPRPLNLDSFQSAFLILGIGSAMALATFLIENVLTYLNNAHHYIVK